MDGLLCSNGLASIDVGYYAYQVENADPAAAEEGGSFLEFRTSPCPPQMCRGGPLQSSTVNQSDAQALVHSQCAHPRVASPLCGECAAGYRVWGSECLRCEEANGPIIVGVILVSYVLVVVFLMSDPSSVGFLEILLYFVQTAMLMVGPMAGWLSWLRVVNLNTASINTCLGPMSAFGQTAVSVLVPVILIGELVTLALLHWLCLPLLQRGAQSPRVPALLRVVFQAMCQVDRNKYVACALVLLSFSYTQVSSSSIAYLTCVEVGPERVVFSTPSIHCDQPEYAAYRVLVLLMLLLLIVGLPLVSIVGLACNRELIQSALCYSLRRRVQAEVSSANKEQRAPRKSILAMDSLSGAAAAHAAEARLAQQYSEDGGESAHVDSSSAVTAAAASFPSSPSSSPVVGVLPFSVPSSSSSVLPHPGYDSVLSRFGSLFSSYHSSAWYWSSMALVRRAVFTAVDVGLVLHPHAKYMSFTMLNLASLLMLTHVRPFLTRALNSADIVAHVALTLISAMLTAFPPPYGTAVQATLCLLILPVTVVLILLFMREVRPVIIAGARRLWKQVQLLRGINKETRAEEEEAEEEEEEKETQQLQGDEADFGELDVVVGRKRAVSQLFVQSKPRARTRTRLIFQDGDELDQ